jgi:hypothetical protein
MARWRSAAIERVPQLRKIIAEAHSVMALWIQLHMKFEDAYREPRNDDLIEQIYSYADWCLDAPRLDDAGHDPLTAVVVAFYEDIPTSPAARADMPRWFRREEIVADKDVFSYHIGEVGFAELLSIFSKSKYRNVPPGKCRPFDKSDT